MAKRKELPGGNVPAPTEADLPPEKIFDQTFSLNMKLANKIEKVIFATHN